MPGRVSERKKHRTPCAVTIDGRRYNGFLIDYSTSGMFIQTSARPDVGQRLDLEFSLHGQQLPMHVEVVRRKTVPAQLRAVAGGGIGVRILSAPESFYALIVAEQESQGIAQDPPVPIPEERARKSPPAQPVSPPAELGARHYRIRVSATQGNRSRTLELEGESESDAARLALEELGEGWKVLEVCLSGSD